MNHIEISLLSLSTLSIVVFLAMAISRLLGLGIGRRTLIAFTRMALQLALVGIYLEVIFRLNNLWINLLWILAMITVANLNILSNSGLSRKKFFLSGMGALCAALFSIMLYFMIVIVSPEPIYDARYFIPIAGMVLGNCLRSNVVALERFFSSIKRQEKAFLSYLMMGAAPHEAIRPFARDAVRAAMNPGISSVATMGLVALPGMMTGQILGGALPLTAIKYQIAVMIAIFTASLISVCLNIYLSLKVAFNEYGMLEKSIMDKI